MKNAATLLAILCLLLPTDLFSQLLINEFYADVATGAVGDANGDGIRSAKEDEFIELVNPTNESVDITGYSIWVSEILRHEFDSTTLAPNSAIVIFGGGHPIGIFGGSPVVLSSSGALGLGNSGSKVELKNPQGIILEEFTYPDENTNTSWTRDPDITGGFKSHFQANAAYGMSFSPGTLINSFPFDSPTNTLTHFHTTKGTAVEGDSIFQLPLYLINPSPTETTTLTIEIVGGTGSFGRNFYIFKNSISFPPNEQGLKYFPIPIIDDQQVEGIDTFLFSIEQVTGGDHASVSLHQQFTLLLEDNDYDFPLLLNEIHADPALGLAGDANGDGIRDAKEDEFLEFVNTSDQELDISNFQLWDASAIRHQIPDGTTIAPNQIFVIFGGGMPTGDFGDAVVQTASTGSLNLLNAGDKIVLKDTSNLIIYAYIYGAEASDNQSIIRCPDLTEGAIATPHSTVGDGALFSPGKRVETCDTTVSSFGEVIEDRIVVFPNPSYGEVYVESSVPLLRLELFNYQGKQLLVTTKQFITLKIESGIYFLKIHTMEGLVLKKIEVF